MDLATRLVEHGLDGRITWTDAADLLDAHDADLSVQEAEGRLLAYRADLDAGPPKFALISPQTERALALAFVISGRSTDWPTFWQGANPLEAFMLDLSVLNPGDHTGLPGRSGSQLYNDLIALRSVPDTKWKHSRLQATIDERNWRTGWEQRA